MLEPQPDYEWFKAATTYTNSSDHFVVVVGADPGTATAVDNTALVTVKDQSGDFIDVIKISFTTSGQAVECMYRRMLCPPGGQVLTNGNNKVSLVECRTLDLALRIL